ncbi:MAG: hypothetical protein L3J67_03255 [Hyphomicrobiaceae bacterium]|nr:hypothetical protein [Hyphomicrobiaceae bacterium]
MGKTALRLVSSAKDLPSRAMDIVAGKLKRSENRGQKAGNEAVNLELFGFGHEFHYWQGLTGLRYLHSVYQLQDCPELAKANYIMVRKLDNGDVVPLCIGQTVADAASLNLAHIRQKAARLGANEIHIHVLTDSHKQRDEVELDLLKGQFARIENKLRLQVANG